MADAPSSSQFPSKFKGWTKPGPRVPGQETLEIAESQSEAGETLDAISGNYRIYQYKDGHRYSTDDLLVAIFATMHSVRAERVLDLGSGIGSVAMIVAWKFPFAKFTTVEAQERSIRLARKSVVYNGLEDRFDLRLGDFREESVLGADEKFDLITGSPPYFPLGDGVLSEHPQKVECRFETRGDVRDYCARAGRHLAPGGMLFLVFPKNQEARLLEGAAGADLVVLRSRAIVFREGEEPLLGLYQLGAKNDFPPTLKGWEEPPLLIRNRKGEVSPEYSVMKLSVGFLRNRLGSMNLKLLKETALLRAFGLVKIPLVFYCAPRVLEMSDEACEIVIPLNFRTKNHLGSMYFGTLAIGADVAGGLVAMRRIQETGNQVGLIFKDFKAEFLKRPEGDVHFRSVDGPKMKALVERALSSGERENDTVEITATCPSRLKDEVVARFWLTVSLKKKSKSRDS